jgi:hypothetical protein
MDFSNTLIRCSSLGKLMTEPKSAADKKAGNLGATAKKHLIEVYVNKVYGRQKDISTKYMEKGLAVEEDSITLYSRITKKYFKKNELNLKNAYISGTPDIYLGKSIKEASEVVDTKSSWDVFTFFGTLAEKINSDYEWQIRGYMGLTGAKVGKIAYCLIDTPSQLISDEQRKLMWKMGVATEEDPLYIEACEALQKEMTFGDIPWKERLIEFTVEHSDEWLVEAYGKVEKARIFLNELFDRLHPGQQVIHPTPEVVADLIKLEKI